MKYLRPLGCLLALAPMVLKLPYWVHTWKASPLDRWDWLFPLAVLLSAAFNWRRLRRWWGAPDWRGLGLAALMLVWLSGAWWKEIHTLQLAGGILFFYAFCWSLGGRRFGAGILPLFLVLLAGCPSTSYWTEYFLRLLPGDLPGSGLIWKSVFALVCLGLFWGQRNRVVPWRQLAFPAGCLLLLTVMLLRQSPALYGEPVMLDADFRQIGQYLGHEEAVTEQEQRFFEGCRLRRLSYYGEQDLIQLLVVELGRDVHKIHPTELCLKSGGADILSAQEVLLPVAGKRLAVQELLIGRTGGRRYLIYLWYVCGEWSSGNFLAFRRSWLPGERWFSFQLMTEVEGSLDVTRERLNHFLDLLSDASLKR